MPMRAWRSRPATGRSPRRWPARTPGASPSPAGPTATTAACSQTICGRWHRPAWSAWPAPIRRLRCRPPAGGPPSFCPHPRGPPVAAHLAPPRPRPPLIDLSLSEVARGKLMVAAQQGRTIPLGWALDRDGQPTTDPKAGLEGSMLPIGAATSPKGAMLALIVELLVTALIGAQFGFEACSFFEEEGNRPRIGQVFIVIDPGALAGTASYLERTEVLVAEMLRDPGLRLPGARREALRRQAERDGIEVPDALLAQWPMTDGQ